MPEEIRYLSFNKKTDWDKGWSANIEISGQGVLLATTGKYAVSQTFALEDTPLSADLADFAVGKLGILYLLDEQANLWVYDHHNRQADLLIESGHGLLSGHARIACPDDILYVADPGGENKLLALSVTNGQMLWSANEIGGAALLPLAVAADGRQNLYVVTPLDIVAANGGETQIPKGGQMGVVMFDPSGRIVRVFTGEAFTVKRKAIVKHMMKNVFAAVSADDGVYVLEAGAKTVFVFAAGGELASRFVVAPESSSGRHFFRPAGIGVGGGNNIYIGDCRKIGTDAEDDRFIYKFSQSGEVIEKIQGFRGRGDKLLLGPGDKIYVWSGEENSITVLELRRRLQEWDYSGLPTGTYITPSFDSRSAETVWHKLVLDADIPENTQIMISYYASDRKLLVSEKRHIPDIDAFIRNDSIPLPEKTDCLDCLWSDPMISPRDALFHGAKGRYLWLKIDFTGSETETPLLKKIRVYFPRISYLRYLPAVYQEDRVSRDFLERFLSLFETFFQDMEEHIGKVAHYFDPDAVAGPFLNWLASWLGIFVDDSWGEEQLRELIKRSPELYRKRGTREGIADFIEVYTGEKPYIVEYFQYSHLKDMAGLKDLIAGLYGMDPYCFCVLVKQECVDTPRRRMVLKKILNEEKPAFTEARLVVLEPRIYMDMHTYLGINTYLSELSLLRLDRTANIPYSAVIIDPDREGRLDAHSRVQLDSGIK